MSATNIVEPPKIDLMLDGNEAMSELAGYIIIYVFR